MSSIYVIVLENRYTWDITSLGLKLYDYENTWKKMQQLEPLKNADQTPSVSVPPVASGNDNN